MVRLQRLLAPEPAEEFSVAMADSGTLVEMVKSLQEELSAPVGEESSLFASRRRLPLRHWGTIFLRGELSTLVPNSKKVGTSIQARRARK